MVPQRLSFSPLSRPRRQIEADTRELLEQLMKLKEHEAMRIARDAAKMEDL